MIYGYARISDKKQNIERQIRNIKKEYPTALIVQEIYTGTKYQERKLLVNLCSKVKEGDTIIFDSVSRMSRNAEEGFKLYKELYNRKVELIFLKEKHINTQILRDTLKNNIEMTNTDIDILLEAINKYLLIHTEKQIKIAFEQSQKEVDDLRQRTKEGIETARLKGKQIGGVEGKKLITKKQKESLDKIKELLEKNLKDIDIMKICKLSRNTYYKYKKIIKGELENE